MPTFADDETLGGKGVAVLFVAFSLGGDIGFSALLVPPVLALPRIWVLIVPVL